jgi:hypothetical protein
VRVTIQGAIPGGIARVKLNDRYKMEISSDVSGRLILIDIDAANTITQIFPNKFTNTDERTRVAAGRSVTLPGPGWEFDSFQAQPPIGGGKLIVIVAPPDFPNIAASGEAQQQLSKGFVPVVAKTSYLMNFLQQIAAYAQRTRQAGGASASQWAYDIIDYVIEP